MIYKDFSAKTKEEGGQNMKGRRKTKHVWYIKCKLLTCKIICNQ